MNYANVLAALFPGAAGRAIAELTRLHALGQCTVTVDQVASEAAVVPDQVRRVTTRLALLGLAEFPVDDQITLVGEHVVWLALKDLAKPHHYIDDRVEQIVSDFAEVQVAAVSGPVAAGTATGYPDPLHVTLVAVEPLAEEAVQAIAETVSRGIGNACRVQVVTNLTNPIGDPTSDLSQDTDPAAQARDFRIVHPQPLEQRASSPLRGTAQWDRALARAFDHLGKRWNGAIIGALANGPRAFAELGREVVGISDSVLADRLAELVAAGLLDRTVAAGPPVSVRYAVTTAGAALLPALDALAEWADAKPDQATSVADRQ